MTTRPQKAARTAAVVTLGCPMNQVDSERIMAGLIGCGFSLVAEEEAEVIVVNTCGFIEAAKQEALDTIFEMAELKATGALKGLVVAGCLAQRYRDDLVRELGEADAIVGLDGRDDIPRICLELLGEGAATTAEARRVVTGPRHSAYLKIAEGCDNRCTYCAIPAIRGPFRSVPGDALVAEAHELVACGARELVLVGQETTDWGRDTGEGDLAALLARLGALDDVAWLRILYAHPARVTDAFIDAMAAIPAVLPYLDIPLQHIAAPVLRRMGRAMPPDDIRRIIASLRDRAPGIVLRTSLMVGFPGETDADFRELMDFVREARFERLGVFVYSPEEGTPAADFGDLVPPEVAEDRHRELMEAQAGIARAFHRSLVGQQFDMIVDDSDPEEGLIFGRTRLDAPDVDGNIVVDGDVEEGLSFVRVRITGGDSYDLTAEMV